MTKANSPYPYMGINGEYFSKEFLQSVEKDLISKIPLWQSGLTTPSHSERFAYFVLKQIKMTPFGDEKTTL